MTFAMLTLGGLGMNAGWWLDQQFGIASCCTPSGTPGFLNWMNAGMLFLGVPAMFLVRYRPQPFNWRRWCCSGMLVLGIPGMVLGMMAGSRLAAAWCPTWPADLRVLADYTLMMAGMTAGMLVPHALEYALPWREPAETRPTSNVELRTSKSETAAGSP